MSEQPHIIEKRVVIAGVATRTLEAAGEGPALLLLHGFTDSADTWRPVLAELAAANRRAVAVDLPGHGFAGPLELPVFEHLDRVVREFVTTYAGDEPAVLAGNSLGGLLAFRAGRDESLPLAAVCGLGPAGLAHTRRLELVTRCARVLHPILLLVDRLPVPRAILRRAVLLVHRRLTEGTGLAVADSYASHVRGMADVSRLRGDLIALSAAEQSEPLVPSEIGVPVLMIWGERDGLADIKGAQLLLDAVPDSRLVTLDCGHCPQVQLPSEVALLLSGLPSLHTETIHGSTP